MVLLIIKSSSRHLDLCVTKIAHNNFLLFTWGFEISSPASGLKKCFFFKQLPWKMNSQSSTPSKDILAGLPIYLHLILWLYHLYYNYVFGKMELFLPWEFQKWFLQYWGLKLGPSRWAIYTYIPRPFCSFGFETESHWVMKCSSLGLDLRSSCLNLSTCNAKITGMCHQAELWRVYYF